MGDLCYLCRKVAADSRDHVPPKGFFPEPLPSNLITVPCCVACNKSYALDDEAFRAWITAPEDLSAAGAWIRREKVFKNTFARSPKLVENIRKHVSEVDHEGRKIDLLSFPKERVDRFLTRIAKGLLWQFYPSIDPQLLSFRIDLITLSEENMKEFELLRDASTYDARGEGVFQFRHRVDIETGKGYWMFVFYEATSFSVWHDRKQT